MSVVSSLSHAPWLKHWIVLRTAQTRVMSARRYHRFLQAHLHLLAPLQLALRFKRATTKPSPATTQTDNKDASAETESRTNSTNEEEKKTLKRHIDQQEKEIAFLQSTCTLEPSILTYLAVLNLNTFCWKHVLLLEFQGIVSA